MNDDLPEPDRGVVGGSSMPSVAGLSPSVAAPAVSSPNVSDTDMDLSADVAREPSVAPPGPVPDRYLGCTIDNRYKVEGIVGEGGMGVVYQCRHKIIDKRVALKILRADLARDAEVTERFLMEAKAASAIQDEHIISISDFGQLPDGAAYFVMEFLEGTPLALLAGGGTPMPLSRIIRIALQLSEGLAAAHQLGIVHRDLKPDNVFLIQRGKETDFVKILDFGIAKVSTSTGGRLTQVGSVFGTPHYMSPEQAAGTPLDHRGDIYSLGVMLYELATGRVPFDAENFVGILSQQLYQDPVPPRAAAPDANIPATFETIILKCMAKKPERRYQSMHQLRDDLLQLEASLGGAKPRDSFEPGRALGTGPGAVALSVDGTALSTELTLASLRPRRWRMYAGIAAPVAMVVAALFWQLGSLRSAPRSTLSADLMARFTGTGTPGSTLSPAPPSAPAEPKTPDAPTSPTHVLLGVAPTTAHVFMGGRDLGQSPVSIEVREGSLASVEVRHPDYEPEQLKLDGSEGRLSIELRAKSKKRPKGRSKGKRVSAALNGSIEERVLASKPGVRAKPAEDKSAGGQLFVEPWQKP
jgi:eukaryotic-like serine/threonine-protein kinase